MYLLSLDQGTTSSRSILFREDGAALATAQREFTQHFPSPGHVEHDAEEILATQLGTARQVLRKAKAVVFVCETGRSSYLAARSATHMGAKGAGYLSGGLRNWRLTDAASRI